MSEEQPAKALSRPTSAMSAMTSPRRTKAVALTRFATGGFEKAYLVLGGEGWKLRAFFTGGGLHKYLVHADAVEILTLEAFVARANQAKL